MPSNSNDLDLPWWRVAPGAKGAYSHPLSASTTSEPSLPVMVVRGRNDGATLLAFAGIHGDEYEPMAVVQRVFADLDPNVLSGTWVAVGCCNVDAYLAGGREGPVDGKNLARVFPGRVDGSLTERVAYCLTNDFIRHASFLCDLHSAGRVFRMVPLAGYMLVGEPLTATQREAARTFGLPLVWGTAPEQGRSLSAAAACGVPAIYCETTGAGGCRPDDVEAYVQGALRLMKHLKMLPGRVEAPVGQRILEDPTPSSGHLQVKNVTPVEGIFLATVNVGDRVTEGDVIGTVVNLFGDVLFECRTDTSGEVILIRHLPRVNAGDALAVVIPL